MKVRTGFVSNSSSSSFIVGFDRRPRSVDDLKKMLFGDGDNVAYYDYTMSAWDIAQRVFADIQAQKKCASEKKVREEASSGYFPGYPDSWNMEKLSRTMEKEFQEKYNLWPYDREKFKDNAEACAFADRIAAQSKVEWAEWQKLHDEAGARFADEVLTKLKGKKIFLFHYADDGGEAVLEHGDIFANLPHYQISHH